MKTLIEGAELLEQPPAPPVSSLRIPPVVQMDKTLILDDHCFQSPTAVVGGVGSGKTTLIIKIVDAVADYACTTGDNIVFFCAKPDLLRFARPGDPLISITNLDPACCSNLFREMAGSPDPLLTLRELSFSLFEEQRKKTLQTFFPDAARDIFFQTARYFYEDDPRAYDNWDLVSFLRNTTMAQWNRLAEEQPAYFSMLPSYLGDGGAQGQAVLSELHTLIANTFYGSFAASGSFSMAETLKKKGQRVFLHYDYAQSGKSSLNLIKFLLELAMTEGMRPEKGNKTWLILDEASLLPHSERLFDALSLGRDPGSNQKGGLRFLLAVQSVQLLTNHYSPEEARTLMSLFPNLICMRCMDPMSRAAMADRYGKARIQYAYAGIGDRVHYVDAVENVVPDYRFSAILHPGDAIMSIPSLSADPFCYHGYRKELE